MLVYVCRKAHFNAAHRLYNPEWSDEKNCEVFGVCANAHGHGHNFELITTVKGVPKPETGFVIDLKLLSRLIKEHLIDQVDHKNLNIEVPFMRNKMASCENLVVEFWKILEKVLAKIAPEVSLHCMELRETQNNSVKYYGNPADNSHN